jgi:guanylate kinase
LSIFLLPPSIGELRARLEKRNLDSPDVISRRMEKSWDEISHWGGYDYVLVNDDLDKTEAQLKTIVEATRLRRLQQPWLNDHVRVLQSEFEETS